MLNRPQPTVGGQINDYCIPFYLITVSDKQVDLMLGSSALQYSR